jgi:Asp-tRNA(Asn)/Glu-tRNA(Gln) amidotransferase A subunit family amidase
MPRLTRRSFVSLATASGVGGATFLDALWNRLDGSVASVGEDALVVQQQQAPAVVTREMITAAERIAGLEFTDAERDMMIANLNRSLVSYGELRTVPLPNAVPPAIQFSPIPLGRTLDLPEAPANTTRRKTVQRPDTEEELAFMPVVELAELVRSRQVSAMELTRLYLGRLERYGPKLECVVTLTPERAMRQAAEADREIAAGRYKGPLHGIPWGAKDLLAVSGYPTSWGSAAHKDQILDDTAAVVERLDAAGAILVAKLTLGALARGDFWFGGRTRNPWKTDQGSSGSSAGPGAATAAGLVAFAIGSETLGSIVSPSTRNGVTGLRPTYGRVSKHGAMTLSWSMDKLGPMCRSAEDCATVLDAIIGADPRDPTAVDAPYGWNPSRPLDTIRVGYLKSAFDADHQTKRYDNAALAAASQLGVPLVPIELPSDLPVSAMRIILNAESAAAFDDLTRSNRDDLLTQQTPNAWPNSFRSARFIPAVEYIQANRVRTLLMQRMAEVFDEVDVFITPSFGGDVLLATNLSGHPAIVMPSGFTDEGTPVSISFIGRLFGESDLCLVAHRWQETTGWHRRHPAGYL